MINFRTSLVGTLRDECGCPANWTFSFRSKEKLEAALITVADDP